METNNKPCEEGGKCPECGEGRMEFRPVENCYCHISPPCHCCVSNPLTCDECGWEEPEETPTAKAVKDWGDYVDKYQEAKSRGHTFPHGGRIFNISCDTRSGSTMEYEGWYEGNVTALDILAYFGDGTFGHRGPRFYGERRGRFTYTKITD